MKTMTATVSSKGQIVIPAEIRRELNITEGRTLAFNVGEDDQISIAVVPTEEEWLNLIADIPHTEIIYNEDGTLSDKNDPETIDWIING
jgi:AbrB family looped-hinge helix DNA binding protein